jgi:hypothetical protein
MRSALVAVTATLALLATVSGCERALHVVSSAQNQAPEIRLMPPGSPLGSSDVVHAVGWTAVDRDGRVDHYLVAVNPRSIDRVDESWHSTAETRQAVHAARRAGPLSARLPGRADEGPTIVAVRAVDDRGAISDPVGRAFFDQNVAPSVTITNPHPSSLVTLLVPPTLQIFWQGVDPDGQFTQKPVRYVYKLIPEGDPDFQIAIIDPDSLRRRYAPEFEGWTSVSGDTTDTVFSNLLIGAQYVFVVTGFDEAGDYDPVFSLNKNMLHVRVAPFEVLGPRITMYNETFYYQYPTGGFFPDPAHEVLVQHPATPPRATFNWFATPALGYDINAYRWVLDPADLTDETPRINEKLDTSHWSTWSLQTTSATVIFRQAALNTDHLFYIEARDNLGNISLGIIRLRFVRVRPNRNLLIVDDTRLRPDFVQGGTLRPPLGPWPTAAELDTFLFARGSVPWQGYPAGTMSTAGVFDGYDYDTLGTRNGLPDATVPLETLLQYRHIVWIVDPLGATFSRSPTDPVEPMTALRYMTSPGRANTLASYLEHGGQVWLMGGGGGYASTIAWNDRRNDGSVITFSSALNELAPGRFMYDETHWRSEFKAGAIPAVGIERAPSPPLSINRVPLELFPARLDRRSPATDPVPPLRTASAFYTATVALEFLSKDNWIIEDVRSGRCLPARPRSTLDTVYVAFGPSLPDPAEQLWIPVMTFYHGRDNGSLMFSGFAPWAFSRAGCDHLIDAVLGGVWHLNRCRPPVVRASPSPGPVEEPVVEANVTRRP